MLLQKIDNDEKWHHHLNQEQITWEFNSTDQKPHGGGGGGNQFQRLFGLTKQFIQIYWRI